jgi:hypothetical protein
MYPKRRVKVQGYTDFEILAECIDKKEAGELEAKLQKKYGYKLDTIQYHKGRYSWMGSKGGAKCVELGHTKKLQQIGHKISASLPRTEAQMEQARKVQKIGAKIAWSKPRTEAQMEQARKVQKIGCVLGGKAAGAISKEKLRVPIAAYNKSDNSHVGEYISVADCARELRISSPDIFSCLSGRQKSTKGYTFIKLTKQ